MFCFDCCVCCVVWRVPHPMEIVKFTYHIGDNVKFKCGGEDWIRFSQKVPDATKSGR